MSDYKEAKELYQLILKNNGYNKMTMIWAISCIENSLQAYDMDLITSEEDKEKMCILVINGWLDNETDVGISRISDVVVENWQELKDSEDNDELLQELINDKLLIF